MKVKAKWAIKVDGAWHRGGEVFETDSIAGLKDCVEVIEGPRTMQVRMEEAGKAGTEAKAEAKAEPAEAGAEAEKPVRGTRTRKKTTK